MLTTEQVLDAQRLHDRATRGDTLVDDEKKRLHAWYAELEQQEAQVLFGKPTPPPMAIIKNAGVEEKLSRLQQEVDALLLQLNETTARLREVMEQNKHLRSEIALLKTQVAQQIALDRALPTSL
ncbi:MAG: hypothetical protein R3C14_07370 [Caldilineaceae bacterium]